MDRAPSAAPPRGPASVSVRAHAHRRSTAETGPAHAGSLQVCVTTNGKQPSRGAAAGLQRVTAAARLSPLPPGAT